MTVQKYYHTEIGNLENRAVYDKPFHINIAGVEEQQNEFHTVNMRNDYYYLYIQEGKLITPDKVLLPGDFIIFEPKYEYSYRGIKSSKYLWVHFTGRESKEFLQKNNINTMVARNIGINRDIEKKFEELFREFTLNDDKSEEIRVNIVKEILLLSERYVSKDKLKKIPLRSIEYINKNYTSEIDIDELASIEEMKLTRFRALFKLHTGVSPVEYIISKRLTRACQLLEQSNLGLEEIAAQVGYADQYYFGRIFKKKIGVSPGRYKRNFVENNNLGG